MDPALLIGRTIAKRYEVLSVAGSGGMGTVFKARQAELDRIVAVKVLDPGLVFDDDAMKRFEREAKSLSKLSNLHIAGFYAYGVLDDSMPYIVMEFIDGESLSMRIQQGESALPVERAIRIALQVSEALACAHKAAIIHRDLKPANILLLSQPEIDFVKVVDFGLSYLGSGEYSEHLTKTGVLMGTPQYLSPEQCMGKRADARSDVYALGCILYEMICGVMPFQAETALAFINKHINEEVLRPSKRTKRELPDGLDLLIGTCLAKDPDHRYQTMDDLREDLRRISEGISPEVQLKRELKGQIEIARLQSVALKVLLLVFLVFGLSGAAFSAFYFSDSGINTRCKVSIEKDSSFENIQAWVKQAEEKRQANKGKEADKLYQTIEKALDNRRLGAGTVAKLKLRLAQDLFKRGDYAYARYFAIASFFDFNETRKQHKLGAHEQEIADRSAPRLKKSKQKISNSRACAALIISLAFLMEDNVNEAVVYANDAATLVQAARASHHFDAETHLLVSMLLEAFDTDWKGPYMLRAMKSHQVAVAALRLSEASQLPVDDAEERFRGKRKSVARTYIAVSDLKGARKNLEQILSMTTKGDPEYDWARLRIAAVDELTGNPAAMNVIIAERSKSMSPAGAAIYISDGRVWAGNNKGANKILEEALHHVNRNTAEGLDDAIGIYRQLAHSWRDCGNPREVEVNLRKCLSLMRTSDVNAGKYNSSHFQVARDLVYSLKDQNKMEEAKKIAEENSITGAELFVH